MLYINNIKQRNGDNSVTVRDFSNSLRLLLWLPSRSTRSLYVVTLSRPPTISSMKITDCSFRCASPRPRNQLPGSFRQPRQSRLDSPPHSFVNTSLIIPTLIIHHSFTLSLQAQNRFFRQILPTLIDFFTHWTAFV